MSKRRKRSKATRGQTSRIREKFDNAIAVVGLTSLVILLLIEVDSAIHKWGYFAVLGLPFGLASGLIMGFRLGRRAKSGSRTLSERTAMLSKELQGAARTIDELQREFEARQALVSQLEQQKQSAEKVVQLHREEVEAAASLLKGVVSKENRKSFLAQTIVGAAFTVAGAVLGIVLTRGSAP
jgi:ABC-type multidrug transport system fused ATPase/permease subunit